MRSAITISLVPQAKGGPFVFWDGLVLGCAVAGDLGFEAVEIFPPGPEAVDAGELRALLSSHRLQVAAVGTGAGWVIHKWSLTHPDAAVRNQARDFIRSIIDFAAEFRAPAIIGSMQGRWDTPGSREQSLLWLGEGLVELSDHAERAGQVLLYEPLNRYETNLLNRLGDATAFLERLDCGQVKLLADLFHLNIEEPSIPTALRRAGSRVGHVHFADSNRQAVGFGHTEMGPIIGALREIGYEGYLSGEILPLPDSVTAAAQTLQSIRQLLA